MDYHAELPTSPETGDHARTRVLAALLDLPVETIGSRFNGIPQFGSN